MTPATWGVRKKGHRDVWSVRVTEDIAKQAFPEAEGWEHFPLFREPDSLLAENLRLSQENARLAEEARYAERQRRARPSLSALATLQRAISMLATSSELSAMDHAAKALRDAGGAANAWAAWRIEKFCKKVRT